MIAFRQFLRKYGITLLPVSVETTKPADILKKEKRGHFPYTHLGKVIEKPASTWKDVWVGASITQESVSRTLSLNGKYSLKSMGVNINGGLAKAKSATYTISGIKAKKLETTDTMEVENFLTDIKSKKPAIWKKIRGKSFVEMTFYATEFTISFDVEGNVDLSAEVAGKLTHDAGASVKWTSKTVLKIAKNNNIPFGVKMFKIK